MATQTVGAITEDGLCGGTPARPAARTRPAPRRSLGDRLFFGALTASALVAPALLLLFAIVLVLGSMPAIREFGFAFITSSAWQPNPERSESYGAFPFIVGTLESSILALLIAAPAGIAIATFINEIMAEQLRGSLRFAIEVLATVPSVVYGLWGIYVMAPFVAQYVQPALAGTLGAVPLFAAPYDPRNMLCAVLILAIMVLPIIVAVSLETMRMVGTSYREAALALGATRWEMIRTAVWPACRSGFIGACILALGRALGETMAVTMVIGNGRRIAWSLFAASDTVASTIANQFAEAPSDLFTASLIEMALLLFVTTVVANLIARALTRNALRAGVSP